MKLHYAVFIGGIIIFNSAFDIQASASPSAPVYALEKSRGRRVKINICVLDYSRGALQDPSRGPSLCQRSTRVNLYKQDRDRNWREAGFLFPAAAHAREDARMIDRPIHRSSGDLSGCLGERCRAQIIELEGKQS